MLSFTRVVLVAAAVVLVSGCASRGNESLRDVSESTIMESVQDGVTTKEQVRQKFGSPLNVSFTETGREIWKYEFVALTADAVNFIPLLNKLGSSASGKKKELAVLFDENGVVYRHIMSESKIARKTGIFN